MAVTRERAAAMHHSTAGSNELPLRRATRWASPLRLLLVGLDATGLLLAWAIALTIAGEWGGPSVVVSIGLAAAISAIGVVVLNAFELYLARTCTIRALELTRLLKAALVTGAAAIVGMRIAQIHFQTREIAVGVLLTFVFLLIFRGGYRAWIGNRRRSGQNIRDVIVVGAGADAAELVSLLEDHADTGYRVVGVLGRRTDALEHGLIPLWCGTPD